MKVLLLTASINPNERIKNTKLLNSDKRLDDYVAAVLFWESQFFFDRIIICDNTNYQTEAFNINGVEYCTFEGDKECVVKYGKGFGEAEIIKYVVDNMNLNPEDIIYKVTGRYSIYNYPKNVELGVLYLRLRMNASYSDSRLFICDTKFIRQYLIPYSIRIDENAGVYFEHILRDACLNFLLDKNKYVQLSTPLIKGTSGTDGRKYKYNLIYRAISSLEGAITKYLYSR